MFRFPKQWREQFKEIYCNSQGLLLKSNKTWEINHCGIMNDYNLIRSRRKTLSLYVDENAQLTVRAPFHLGQKYIKKFIKEKENWIMKQTSKMKKRIENRNRYKELIDEKTLKNIKKRAKDKLYNRLSELSEKYDYPFVKMRLSGAKSRWGSCSHKNTISLNWKVMFAPPRVIDYLIIHELVHTKHKNHQSDFWKAVAQIHPTYKEDRKWLRENAHLLSIDT